MFVALLRLSRGDAQLMGDARDHLMVDHLPIQAPCQPCRDLSATAPVAARDSDSMHAWGSLRVAHLVPFLSPLSRTNATQMLLSGMPGRGRVPRKRGASAPSRGIPAQVG